jgi:hypothetical protein
VQDISETSTSLLLLVVGMGHVTIYSNASKTAESVKLPLRLDACIAIKCNSSYSLGLTRAVYLHCTCTLKRAFFHGSIYVPLRYACPYKSSLSHGEMRRYLKNFLPNPDGDCKYSGSRWKNILDRVEMRADLTQLTGSLLASYVPNNVRLGAIEILNVNICDKKTFQQLQEATHVYSSNILFSAEALLAIEGIVCWLPNVRYICVVQHPCPRHSARCTKPFCHLWIYESSIKVPVTYSNTCVELWFFKRR